MLHALARLPLRVFALAVVLYEWGAREELCSRWRAVGRRMTAALPAQLTGALRAVLLLLLLLPVVIFVRLSVCHGSNRDCAVLCPRVG